MVEVVRRREAVVVARCGRVPREVWGPLIGTANAVASGGRSYWGGLPPGCYRLDEYREEYREESEGLDVIVREYETLDEALKRFTGVGVVGGSVGSGSGDRRVWYTEVVLRARERPWILEGNETHGWGGSVSKESDWSALGIRESTLRGVKVPDLMWF